MVGQLELGAEELDASSIEVAHDAPTKEIDDHTVAGDGDDDSGVAPWTPEFDEADDLDGLLAARSPLLSRAFRTAGRAGR